MNPSNSNSIKGEINEDRETTEHIRRRGERHHIDAKVKQEYQDLLKKELEAAKSDFEERLEAAKSDFEERLEAAKSDLAEKLEAESKTIIDGLTKENTGLREETARLQNQLESEKSKKFKFMRTCCAVFAKKKAWIEGWVSDFGPDYEWLKEELHVLEHENNEELKELDWIFGRY